MTQRRRRRRARRGRFGRRAFLAGAGCAALAGAAALMDNCLSIGLNTVIAQVRPFGDALYRSNLFPWSHLCTGVQGQDPGFDPLDVLITEAHSRGLSLEAWVNPYRLRSSAKMPPALAENNLANVHPEWVCAVGEGLYLNPAIPEAADYVVKGVADWCRTTLWTASTSTTTFTPRQMLRWTRPSSPPAARGIWPHGGGRTSPRW